jgi:hypothetical protein
MQGIGLVEDLVDWLAGCGLLVWLPLMLLLLAVVCLYQSSFLYQKLYT